MTITKETIWVVGASSGIGLSIASELAKQGNHVIVSARNVEALNTFCQQFPDNATALKFDVTNKESIAEKKAQLNKITARLDRVILNAGNCQYFDVNAPDWSMFERITAVNYHGMVNSLAVCFDMLKETARETEKAHIVGIASQAIHCPFTQAQAYGGSKAAATYFLDAMRIDCKPLGIDVTTIHPGFIDTPLTQKNDFEMPFLMSVEKATPIMLSAIKKRKKVYNFPRSLRIALFINKIKTQVFI